LVAQPAPKNLVSPFYDLAKKRNLKISFSPFVSVEGQTVKNIRLQKINIPKYTALILTSRNAVNHYFRICEEMRIVVSNSLKYFCISEAVSYYLQKYIAYRKRKIYSANNNFTELVELMEKHEQDKFLLVSSDFIRKDIISLLDESQINYTRGVFFKTVPTNVSKINLSSFDILVFYSPRDIDSLFSNFPDFNQNNTKIAVFGETTYEAAINANLEIDIKAPSSTCPSMSMALDVYLKTKKSDHLKK